MKFEDAQILHELASEVRKLRGPTDLKSSVKPDSVDNDLTFLHELAAEAKKLREQAERKQEEPRRSLFP